MNLCSYPTRKFHDPSEGRRGRFSKHVRSFLRVLVGLAFILIPDLARALTLAPGDVLLHSTLRIDPVTGVQQSMQTQGTVYGTYDLDPDGRPVIYTLSGGDQFGNYNVGLARIDPLTGEVTPLLTSSLLYKRPDALAVDGAGDVFVLMIGGIFRAQLDDGTVHALRPVPIPTPPYTLNHITVGSDGNLYGLEYAFNPLYGQFNNVLRIDPITGEKTIISSGGDLVAPQGIEVTSDGRILVVDSRAVPGTSQQGAVLEIDPSTGAQTIITSGGGLQSPRDICTDAAGRNFILDPGYRSSSSSSADLGAVYTIDPSRSAVTLVSTGGSIGSGGNLRAVRPYDLPWAIVPRPEDFCLVPAFTPPVNTLAELTPVDVATADVDGDGAQDVIVSNFFSGSVSVLLGRGDGSLMPQVSYPIGGTYADALAVGDLNDDDAPDIVVANFSSYGVAVLLNQGDGTFAPAVPYLTGTSPTSVAIGDLDRDGAPDLAVANNYTQDVTLLFGRGDGTFVRRGGNLSMGNRSTDAVALGDLDRDGNLDLVVGNGGAGIAVLLGQGGGAFGARITYPAGYNANDIELADFDGDGNLDVAESDFYGNGVYLLRGRGDGTLDTSVFIKTGEQVSGVAVGDFNLDGKPDLAVANRMTDDTRLPDYGNVTVLMNYKEGKFAPRLDFDMNSTPGAVAIADLDGDGGPELISANLNSWDVSVRRGLPTVTIGPRRMPFHEQAVGTDSAPGQITVKSCGPAPLEVSGASVAGPEADAFSVIQDECSGRELAPQESCTMDVTFAPVGGGWHSAVLDAETDAALGPHAVELRGTSPNADLEVNLSTTQKAFVQKSEIVYTVALRNSGPTTARNVVATFTPPDGSNKGVFATSQGICTIPGGKNKKTSQTKATGKIKPTTMSKSMRPVCSLGMVEPGGHVTAQFAVTKLKAPLNVPLEATVDVTTETFDPDMTNNSAAVSVVVFKKR